MTENESYSRPMQVVSNTICLFILCAAPLSELRAGITRDGAIISMALIMALEPPHNWKRSEGI